MTRRKQIRIEPDAIAVRRLAAADVEDFRTIRLAALQGAPDAFGSTFEREVRRPMAAFGERLAASIVFAAYAGAEIVGMAGLMPESGHKERHKGFFWGLYVRPEARRVGAASAIVETMLASTPDRMEQITLSVVSGNTAAQAFYEKFGFTVYGVEPRSMKTGSRYLDEVLMVRFLTPSTSA